jgi:hypothetical protein
VAYTEPLGPAQRCDYAYQFGSSVFVCWNVIPPHDIGLDLDADTATSPNFFANVDTLIYCDDEQDNPFVANNVDSLPGEVSCSGTRFCSLDRISVPEDIIGRAMCPNGETVTRYIQYCTPEGPTGTYSGTCDTELPVGDECELGFCDFGENAPFPRTEYSFEKKRKKKKSPNIPTKKATKKKITKKKIG